MQKSFIYLLISLFSLSILSFSIENKQSPSQKTKAYFNKQIEDVINFNKKAINLSIQKGFMIKEPHEGHYNLFVQNVWAILHSWLTKREVFGNRKVSLDDAVLAVLEMHFLYLTKK